MVDLSIVRLNYQRVAINNYPQLHQAHFHMYEAQGIIFMANRSLSMASTRTSQRWLKRWPRSHSSNWVFHVYPFIILKMPSGLVDMEYLWISPLRFTMLLTDRNWCPTQVVQLTHGWPIWERSPSERQKWFPRVVCRLLTSCSTCFKFLNSIEGKMSEPEIMVSFTLKYKSFWKKHVSQFQGFTLLAGSA